MSALGCAFPRGCGTRLRASFPLSACNIPCLSALRPSYRPHSFANSTTHHPKGNVRHFSGFLEGCVEFTQNALVSYHGVTGLPWYLTIPAFALGVQLTMRLPLQLYVRNIARKRAKVRPLKLAWSYMMTRSAATQGLRIRQRAKELIVQKHRQIDKIYGTASWKTWLTVLAIPPWFIVPEAIRRMVGAGGGIISLLTGQYEADRQRPTDWDAASSTGTPEASYHNFAAESWAPAESAAATTTTTGISAAGPSTDVVTQPMDAITQSLANGGTLWFPDLTVADSTGLLCFTLMGLMVLPHIPKDAAARRALFNLSTTDQPQNMTTSPWRLRVARGMLFASIVLPLAVLKLPAGIVLYWVSSAAINRLLTILGDWYIPMPKSKGPCKKRVNFTSRLYRY